MFQNTRHKSCASDADDQAIAGQTAPLVLIADDDATLVQVLAMRCKQLGLQVMRSPDSMHALLGTHRAKPDLVILDINMPGGNGLATCEMIVSDKSLANTSVIIMSGEADTALAERCCRALGATYVRKGPDLWEELQNLICQLLDVTPASEPSTRSKGQDPERTAREANRKSGEDPAAPRPKVLCIDDDPDITQVIKLRLEPYGADVIRAFNGMQGFWTAVDQQPDVIICDMNMPDGQGSYVNGRLKDHPVTRDVPVIILTGLANPALKRQMIALGVAAYLQKPLVFAELLGALKKHLPLIEDALKNTSQTPRARHAPCQNTIAN